MENTEFEGKQIVGAFIFSPFAVTLVPRTGTSGDQSDPKLEFGLSFFTS